MTCRTASMTHPGDVVVSHRDLVPATSSALPGVALDAARDAFVRGGVA